MQGYAYVNAIYPEVYAFLRDGGHLLRALDDEVIHDRVQERVVQNIAVAYVNDFEGLGDPKGMMRKLLERRRYSELGHLIWFVWTWRDTKDGAHRQRIFELWERLVKAIDTTTPDGKKIASKLCTWIAFVDEVDEQRKELLLSIVPYVDEDHSAFGVLENIARISEKQPEVASEIWLKMLEKSRPDYPHEAIQHALANIAKEKGGGLRRAQIIVDHYIRAGNGRPAEVLADVIAGATKS